METRVGKMKKCLKIILVSFCISIAACSDKQEESQQQAQRHAGSAKIYMEQGQYRAAMIEAKNVIQLMPDSADGYIIEMKENKNDERRKLLKQLQAKLESILELIE